MTNEKPADCPGSLALTRLDRVAKLELQAQRMLGVLERLAAGESLSSAAASVFNVFDNV